jgi:hypothetical protein
MHGGRFMTIDIEGFELGSQVSMGLRKAAKGYFWEEVSALAQPNISLFIQHPLGYTIPN